MSDPSTNTTSMMNSLMVPLFASTLTKQTFHTGFGDAVFSQSFIPTTPAAYFGTWLFIFVLGVISRAILAGKALLEGYWYHKHASTAIVINTNDDGKATVVTGGKNVMVWRTSVDLPRSFIQLVSSGVQYLLYVPSLY